MEYINLKVVGNKEELNDFLNLLVKIQYAGRISSNITIPVVVDGDGSGRLKFECVLGDGIDVIEKIAKQYKENGIFAMQVDADKIEPHYIGE